MELTLIPVMALEMELCALLLETMDTRVLGPPKMRSEEEKGLQAVKWGWSVCKTSLKTEVEKRGFFLNPPKMNLLQVLANPKSVDEFPSIQNGTSVTMGVGSLKRTLRT